MRRISLLTMLVLIATMALTGGMMRSASAQDLEIECGDVEDPPDGAITGSGLINGTNGADVIYGSDEDDQIYGKGGNDIICAGAGADLVDGGSGNDLIEGGEGDDDLRGGSGHDEIIDFQGHNTVDGGSGNDFIVASGSPLKGGTGNDYIDAVEEDLPSLQQEGEGSVVQGGSGSDELYGTIFGDDIQGQSGNDYLNDGDQILWENGGALDTLNGGTGTDTCVGDVEIEEEEDDDFAIGQVVDTFISCEIIPEPEIFT